MSEIYGTNLNSTLIDCKTLITQLRTQTDSNKEEITEISDFIREVELGLQSPELTQEFRYVFEGSTYEAITALMWTQINEKWRLCLQVSSLTSDLLKPLIECSVVQKKYAVLHIFKFLQEFHVEAQNESYELYCINKNLEEEAVKYRSSGITF